ncbi:hypothetical protein E2C01_094749 [Portunus trituberculatus]|uniref:Uncharacterized protein n=1 Tax=Portunus trituberculatus TaxID=210409 RepID=A0A5B7JR92_PORTR|nr:hypothetical protein [Portunus trituberculatus]
MIDWQAICIPKWWLENKCIRQGAQRLPTVMRSRVTESPRYQICNSRRRRHQDGFYSGCVMLAPGNAPPMLSTVKLG